MPLLLQIRRLIAVHLARPSGYTIALLLAFYFCSSWALLFLSGEKQLVDGVNFVYWILVTASTVGYGDLSPQTAMGRWLVALYVIPVGLTLFAMVVGRFVAFLASQWRKSARGLSSLNMQNHILVIGWNGNRTLRLLKLLLREQQFHPHPSQIVLCVTADMENPLPGSVEFVRVNSFTDDQEMDRANIGHARSIILDNAQDDITMTSALYCNSRNPRAHTIAYFQDEKLAPLLTRHCPNVECTPSVGVEMMAKAAVDPGSSLLHHQLLDVNEGMTQYSIEYPAAEQPRPLQAFFGHFKKHHHATLIGVADTRGGRIDINPPLEREIGGGSIIYYIADERIAAVNWKQLDV